MPEILILGAGKIGRGFIAHLAHRSGWKVSFADAAPGLISALQHAGRYRVDIAGRPEASEWVPVHDACTLTETERLAAVIARADLLACAVGAGNLRALAQAVAPALIERAAMRTPLDWLILENADQPAKLIREELLRAAAGQEPASTWLQQGLGLVETQVLRSGMPHDASIAAADPLAVKMHNWWTLPADKDAFRAALPAITGLQPRGEFAHELRRKLYTFNGLNGPISYLGWINGYSLLDQAARSSELEPLLRQVQEESAHGLIREYGFDPLEHAAFQRIAWDKYRDSALADQIERNARDSARKLGAHERLIGPAALCLKHGRQPLGYAIAAAAAVRYRGSDDPGTRSVQDTLASTGMAGVLAQHSGLGEGSELARLIIAADARQAWRLRPEHAHGGTTT